MFRLKKFFLVSIFSSLTLQAGVSEPLPEGAITALTVMSVFKLLSSTAAAWTSFESKDELAPKEGQLPRPNMEGSTALSGLAATGSIFTIVALYRWPHAQVHLAGTTALASGMAFALSAATFGADQNKSAHPYSDASFGLTLASFLIDYGNFLRIAI